MCLLQTCWLTCDYVVTRLPPTVVTPKHDENNQSWHWITEIGMMVICWTNVLADEGKTGAVSVCSTSFVANPTQQLQDFVQRGPVWSYGPCRTKMDITFMPESTKGNVNAANGGGPAGTASTAEHLRSFETLPEGRATLRSWGFYLQRNCGAVESFATCPMAGDRRQEPAGVLVGLFDALLWATAQQLWRISHHANSELSLNPTA